MGRTLYLARYRYYGNHDPITFGHQGFQCSRSLPFGRPWEFAIFITGFWKDTLICEEHLSFVFVLYPSVQC